MIVEGPVSVVDAEVAYGLLRLLAPGRRWARANGITLQGPLAVSIEELEALAAAYTANGISGISGVPLDGDSVTMPSVRTDLDASTVARLLGCGERNVTARAAKGTLPGAHKVRGGGSRGGRESWRFDPQAIAELVGPAALMAVLEEAG